MRNTPDRTIMKRWAVVFFMIIALAVAVDYSRAEVPPMPTEMVCDAICQESIAEMLFEKAQSEKGFFNDMWDFASHVVDQLGFAGAGLGIGLLMLTILFLGPVQRFFLQARDEFTFILKKYMGSSHESNDFTMADAVMALACAISTGLILLTIGIIIQAMATPLG